MLRQLSATAVTLAAVGLMACSVEEASSEDLASVQEASVSCTMQGLEWKVFLADLAYDAAEDFGMWEFTQHTYINGDRLAITQAGYTLCQNRGRPGCPSMTAGLSAQEGTTRTYSGGKLIHDPYMVRDQLTNGWRGQDSNESNQNYITDPSETGSYASFRSATRTGLPHTVALSNCAVTAYEHGWYSGKSQCLRTGTLRMAGLTASGAVGNDAISSIKVRSGFSLKLYEHDQFQGATKSFTADHPALWDAAVNFNDKASSLTVSDNTGTCSAWDTYKVTVGAGADWTKIRGKLVTLGYMRGNDVLDVRIDLNNQTIDVDPFNVDFIPPSQIGGTTYGVDVKSAVAETWRSTEDPYPSILPVNSPCRKKPYGATSYYDGVVKAIGYYRYCYVN